MTVFDYAVMTDRTLGFVTGAKQARLRAGTVFVCGTGGMGGAAVLALARVGGGRLILADIDRFELSNLNRQVFATLDTPGAHKAEATAARLARINPEMAVEVWHDDWTGVVERLVDAADAVINGTDDLGASLLLYRTARDARSPAQGATAFLREAEHVILHFSSRRYIDLDLVAEVVAGWRSRMSFAPMVIATGRLMVWEAIRAVLGQPRAADNRGWFLNPHAGRVERPRPAAVAALLRPRVRRGLERLAGGAG